MKNTKTTLPTAKTVAANNLKERAQYLQTNPKAINYKLRQTSMDTLRALIAEVADAAGMDKANMDIKLKLVTSRSEYGKVPALINLLASTANWPLDKDANKSELGDAKEIVTGMLPDMMDTLEDVHQAKGYHTFVSDDHEIVDGIEPDYEEYGMLVQVIAEKLQLPVVDLKLDETVWDKNEAKAEKKADKTIEDIKDELAEHNKLHGAA